MLTGAHFLLYSKDPDADRAFLRDALDLKSVEIGHGWMIFKLPASELAVHPADGNFEQKHADHPMLGAVLYFMCDDLPAQLQALDRKGIHYTPVQEAPWGRVTSIPLPSGGHIGLYQPLHKTALDL